jgi:hypothetical protein
MYVTKRGKYWEIINSWWVLLSFVFSLNWLSLFYAGLKTKKKMWIIWGLLYLIPVVVLYIVAQDKNPAATNVEKEYTTFETIFYLLFFFSWIISIIHSFSIRKDFLIRLDTQTSHYHGHPFSQGGAQGVENEKHKKIRHLNGLRDDIIKKIDRSKKFDSAIISDLKPLIENYIKQAGQLIERDEKLDNALSGFSAEKLQKTINDYESKLGQTENEALKDEYKSSIEKYREHITSLKDLKEQREMIRLRLDTIMLSMQQVKYDLIKLEDLESQEQRDTIYKTFEEKSKDISEYLNVLEKSFKNLNLS